MDETEQQSRLPVTHAAPHHCVLVFILQWRAEPSASFTFSLWNPGAVTWTRRNVSRDAADKRGKWVKVQLWVNFSFQRCFWLWSADVASHSEVGEAALAPIRGSKTGCSVSWFHLDAPPQPGMLQRGHARASGSGGSALMRRVTAEKRSWTLKDRRLFNGSDT